MVKSRHIVFLFGVYVVERAIFATGIVVYHYFLICHVIFPINIFRILYPFHVVMFNIGRCKGGKNIEYNKDCCTANDPCGNGEGDCDRDDHCAGNLVCMPKICGKAFGDNAECCTHRGKV